MLQGKESNETRISSVDDITRHLVHVNFIKFIEVNHRGGEIISDRRPAIGYIAYNADWQEFGQRSFDGSDEYTLISDVHHHLQDHHPRLAESVSTWGGFYLSGQWCPAFNGQPILQ